MCVCMCVCVCLGLPLLVMAAPVEAARVETQVAAASGDHQCLDGVWGLKPIFTVRVCCFVCVLVCVGVGGLLLR